MTDPDEVKKAKGLKFSHLNIRSLINKVDQFRVHFARSNLDIITLSETWLTKDISSNILEMEGYQLYRGDRSFVEHDGNGIKKGGGLVIYARKDLNFTLIHNDDNNISLPDCEIRRLELCSTHQKNIIV